MQIQDKVPTFSEFKLNPVHAVAYILLLYFIYKEFTDSNKCKELEVIIVEYKSIIVKQDQRISNLENFIDIKNGIIKKIEHKLDSTQTE